MPGLRLVQRPLAQEIKEEAAALVPSAPTAVALLVLESATVNDRSFTPQEVARRLHLNEQTVRRYLR